MEPEPRPRSALRPRRHHPRASQSDAAHHRRKLVTSNASAHPALIGSELFESVQCELGKRGERARRQRAVATRSYALAGLVACELCDRLMAGTWTNQQTYYRCRATAPHHSGHPANVYLCENDLVAHIHTWIKSHIDPTHLLGLEEGAANAEGACGRSRDRLAPVRSTPASRSPVSRPVCQPTPTAPPPPRTSARVGGSFRREVVAVPFTMESSVSLSAFAALAQGFGRPQRFALVRVRVRRGLWRWSR